MGTRENGGLTHRGDRGQAFPRSDATTSPVPDVAHRLYGHLDIVDVRAYVEGRLVGPRPAPYDWARELDLT